MDRATERRSIPRWRRAGPLSWLPLLVTLVATSAAIGFAYAEQKEAGRARSATGREELLARRLAELDAAEWRAIASDGGADAAVRQVREARARADAALHAVAAAEPHVHRTLERRYGQYVAALDRETALLAEGRVAAARATDSTSVDPAAEALRAVVDETTARHDRRAARAAASADRITWIATALGLVTMLLLLGQLLAQRRLLATEREHLEELKGLDRLKDEFVASVSHELRTPLTSIRGYLELVLDGEAGELKPEQRNFLAVVDRNTERLLRLVSDLLDVAQIESGRLALDVDEEDLSQFVAEAVEAARPVALDRGIDLELQTNGGARVRIDRTRLAQVLDNLLSNALKFTDPGGRVDVRVSAPNGVVAVEVADTGMGISPDEQAKLFQRFYRTAAAGEHAIPGTGLGLWISKAIVEAHGGEIAVDSGVGRGTTFRVELPTTEHA